MLQKKLGCYRGKDCMKMLLKDLREQAMNKINHEKKEMLPLALETPCPSASVRCTPVGSPVDKFAEIVSPVPNYASPTNKRISFFLPQS